MPVRHAGFAVAFALLLSGPGCKKEQPPSPAAQATAVQPVEVKKPEPVTIPKNQLGAYQPLPEVFASDDNPITDAKVELGRMLYYDERLSKNHDISCNTCHLLDRFGVDGKPVSLGHKQQPGTRNSPTVYNAAGQFVQFWDGRSPDIEDQALQPVLNPVEMAMPTNRAVLKVLRSIPGYVEAFKKAFPEDKRPVTYDNLGKAIGAFERKLVTPAPWDAFLKGDEAALTDEQKQGFITFTSTGCPACHTGPLLGGHMYQKTGLINPWPNQKDQGRYEVTKKEGDKMMFKVPSLRNVVKTGPYFHDGSVAELPRAVEMMAHHQLGKKIEEKDVRLIIAFLGALTGEIPTTYIEKPALPESGKRTPKPDPN